MPINEMNTDFDKSIIDTKRSMKELIKTKQKTTPGLFVNAYSIEQSDWDKTNDFETLMQDYTDIRNGDAFASSSVDILINPILNSEIKIKPGKINDETEPSALAQEAAEYIKYCYDNIYNKFKYFQRHRALAIFYGCAFFEEIWLKADEWNGHITNRLVKLSPIQTDTINRYYYDPVDAEFIGLRLYKRLPGKGTEPIDITADRLHRFTPIEEFNNVQGRGVLRPVRLDCKIKTKIKKASARAAERGAGTPVITLDKSVKDTDTVVGTKVKTIVQTVGNSENCGVVDQEGVFTFRMEPLQNQQDNIPILNFCNSEIAYNSLIQFVISGIGQSGSRAATGEHKAPYIEALNGWIKTFEEDDDALIEKMIDNSYLYGMLDRAEYPHSIYERATEKDLTETAANWNVLVNSRGITPTPKDETFIRSIFKFPEVSEEEIQAEKDKKLKEAQETMQSKYGSDNKNGIVEKKNKEEKTFSLDNVQRTERWKGQTHPGVEYLNVIEGKVKDIIDRHYKEMVSYASSMLQKGLLKPVKIPESYKNALYKDLNTYYNQSAEAGYKQGESEIKQFDTSIKLEKKSTGFLKRSNNSKKLEFIVDMLSSNIENQINTNMLNVNESTISKKGGINSYIDETFGESQNTVKASLLNNTLSGYVSGIHEAQDDYESESGNELIKTYTLQLERQNVCEKCFPYEGLKVTQAEADDLGLNWTGTPLNPECLGLLGKNQCQCVWRAEGIMEGGSNV